MSICDQCGCKGLTTTMLKYSDDPRPAQQYCGTCYTIYMFRAMNILKPDSEEFKKYDVMWKRLAKKTIEPEIDEK